MAAVIEGLVDPQVGADSCPHLAVLLKSYDELPQVLASFYALGAKRNGWLAHRSLPGESDMDRRAPLPGRPSGRGSRGGGAAGDDGDRP